MGAIVKDIGIGVLVSLFAMSGSFFIYLEYFSTVPFEQSLEAIREMNLYGKIISLACIPNLFVFWVFIKKRQDDRAKGVLVTTIVAALTTLVLKFI